MSTHTASANEKKDWHGIVQQIHDKIGTNTALIDKYGMILASKITQFPENSVISPLIWHLIANKTQLTTDMHSKRISTLILGAIDENYVVSMGENLHFLSVLPQKTDITQYIQSISRILTSLDSPTSQKLSTNFQSLDLNAEYQEMEAEAKKEIGKERFPVFKHLIVHLMKK